MLELAKLKVRADEFNDYGELDMMQQYVQDIRNVQVSTSTLHLILSYLILSYLTLSYLISSYLILCFHSLFSSFLI